MDRHPRGGAVRETLIGSNQALAATWAAEAAVTSTLVDALGRRLDPGVTDTVVALRLSGFRTEQSCWGHWHRAVPGPWMHALTDFLIHRLAAIPGRAGSAASGP